MRHVKFILSSLAILLAGAMAAGLAARSVTAPRAGEVVSAGTVPIPSVLGRTAEEVLFYPWSLYDMQTLVPLPEEVQGSIASDIDLAVQDATMSSIAAMDALGADYDLDLLLKGLTWNQSELKTADMVFLKDFPAVLDDGAPVLLSYALSFSGPLSMSWLMTPREAAEISEEQRQAALDKVRDDLTGMLWYLLYPHRDYTSDMAAFLQGFDHQFQALNLKFLHERLEIMIVQVYDNMIFSYQQETIVIDSPDSVIQEFKMALPSEAPPQEELLESVNNSGGASIQLVSAPSQIIVLFTSNTGTMLGVYYDIQLERYSGLGVSE